MDVLGGLPGGLVAVIGLLGGPRLPGLLAVDGGGALRAVNFHVLFAVAGRCCPIFF